VLEQRLAVSPDDGDLLLRYAAALYSAGRCDSAVVVARRGMAIEPGDALGPLVSGQCLQQAGELDAAVATYDEYLAAYPNERGAASVRARLSIARRERALARARQALARESDLASQPAEPTTIAVLPVDVVGDSTYRPLSRGLAELMTTDLALLQRFRMVERLQVGALLEEMNLAAGRRVDEATAARVGRMLQAGRMVQGLASIPPSGTTRLEASVVVASGEVSSPASQSGELSDLLRMEKAVVIELARQLGYELSEAERQLILENGTQNLAAFLAYSRGLEAEDAGDYRAASQHYGDAVRSDPGFQAARDAYQTVETVPEVLGAEPAAVSVLASEPPPPTDQLVQPLVGDPLSSTVVDVASTQIEAVSPTTAPVTTGATTTASQPPPTIIAVGTSPTGIVRIVFRLP
jgi:tetratricopeptide (TPR) repeat protein